MDQKYVSWLRLLWDQIGSISEQPVTSPFLVPKMGRDSIQGRHLEVTVVGCNKLKDTEWISRQDPYVCLEYGSTKFRTRTCTDGGKTPAFQEKFVFNLIEGLREINISVWNSNTLTLDAFIGSGKVQLHKVLSQGYDDSPWPLQTKTGRYAGEAQLILHYENANKSVTSSAPTAPPCFPQAAPPYSAPHYENANKSVTSSALTAPPCFPQAAPPPPLASPYAPPPTAYAAPPPYSAYHPNPAAYPPPPYIPTQLSAYPPPAYPPSAYPPPPYLPPPGAPHYPPGPYPRLYPPPPY